MRLKCLSLRRKKKVDKIPLFLNKLTKKLLFCILFLKIKNNRNKKGIFHIPFYFVKKKAKPFSSYKLFFYFIILFVLQSKTEKECLVLFVLKTEKESVNNF